MINKVKEFINMRKELYSVGVIGVSLFENSVHVKSSVLSEMPNVQFESYESDDYPFKAFAMVDDIKLFALVHKDDVKKFPQLDYMVDDVNLSGDEDAAI